MYALTRLLLLQALSRVCIHAAPLQLSKELHGPHLVNGTKQLGPRQIYNPALAQAGGLNEMLNMVADGAGVPPGLQGVGLRTLMRFQLYRTELTMAGGLEPEAAAEAAEQTAEQAGVSLAEVGGEAVEIGSQEAMFAALEIGSEAVDIGAETFMGDLAGLPMPYAVAEAAAQRGIHGGWSMLRLIADMTAKTKYPALTGAEGIELPSDFAVFIEGLKDSQVALANSANNAIEGLAASVGEDFTGLLAAGASAPLAAAFMIGVTAWAAQWTYKTVKNIDKGWHNSLEGFGNILKRAMADELHIDIDKPLPNGAPLGSMINGLTGQMWNIYSAAGNYEDRRLRELGAPVEQFKTPDHSANVQAMKTWAQTDKGKDWCEETKMQLVNQLKKAGIVVDITKMKIPLRDSCPPPGSH